MAYWHWSLDQPRTIMGKKHTVHPAKVLHVGNTASLAAACKQSDSEAMSGGLQLFPNRCIYTYTSPLRSLVSAADSDSEPACSSPSPVVFRPTGVEQSGTNVKETEQTRTLLCLTSMPLLNTLTPLFEARRRRRGRIYGIPVGNQIAKTGILCSVRTCISGYCRIVGGLCANCSGRDMIWAYTPYSASLTCSMVVTLAGRNPWCSIPPRSLCFFLFRFSFCLK